MSGSECIAERIKEGRGSHQRLGCLYLSGFATSDVSCWGPYRQDATPAREHLQVGKFMYFQDILCLQASNTVISCVCTGNSSGAVGFSELTVLANDFLF